MDDSAPWQFLRRRVGGCTTHHGMCTWIWCILSSSCTTSLHFWINCSSHLRDTVHAKSSSARRSWWVVPYILTRLPQGCDVGAKRLVRCQRVNCILVIPTKVVDVGLICLLLGHLSTWQTLDRNDPLASGGDANSRKSLQLALTLEGHTDHVWSLDMNQSFIVSGSWDSSVRIWSR